MLLFYSTLNNNNIIAVGNCHIDKLKQIYEHQRSEQVAQILCEVNELWSVRNIVNYSNQSQKICLRVPPFRIDVLYGLNNQYV